MFFWVLALGNVLVVAGHILWKDKIGFFDLDKEMSLPSLWTGLQLLAAGFSFGVLGYLRRHKLWIPLAGALIFVGMDEIMFLHERITFFLNKYLEISGYYGESFNWLIYFAPFVILALIVFFRVALRFFKWPNLRKHAGLFIVGVVFFILSLALEIGGFKTLTALNFDANHGFYFNLIILEEFSEMLGASAFLALSFYLLGQFRERSIVDK